jgi:hypothetical protein
MKYALFISKLALLLWLFSCGEQKAESISTIVENPVTPKDNRTEEDEEIVKTAQLPPNINPENTVVQDSIKILGTWVSEEDKSWKLIFTPDGKCYQHYGEEVIFTESFAISNTSPQCDFEVTVDANSAFLQLTNVDDQSETCYYINGLSDKYLSLSPVGQGGVLLFVRK